MQHLTRHLRRDIHVVYKAKVKRAYAIERWPTIIMFMQ